MQWNALTTEPGRGNGAAVLQHKQVEVDKTVQ